MTQAERRGLGLALAGHLLLFGILSLSLMMRNKPAPEQLPIDVSIVDKVGLQTASPSREPPAPSEAPEVAPQPEAPPPPEPTPAPPKPEPKPLPPEPSPVPAPKAKVPPKVEKQVKPEPTKPKLSSDILKGLSDPKTAKTAKATGARLGPDFLKGIGVEKVGKSATQRAAITGPQMASLAAAIAAQVKPCYNVPVGGTDSANIVTILRLRFNRDGTLATKPTIDDHQGVTESNKAYVQQMDDAAVRAVMRCAPLRLPPELYENGWKDIIPAFRPRDLG